MAGKFVRRYCDGDKIECSLIYFIPQRTLLGETYCSCRLAQGLSNYFDVWNAPHRKISLMDCKSKEKREVKIKSWRHFNKGRNGSIDIFMLPVHDDAKSPLTSLMILFQFVFNVENLRFSHETVWDQLEIKIACDLILKAKIFFLRS